MQTPFSAALELLQLHDEQPAVTPAQDPLELPCNLRPLHIGTPGGGGGGLRRATSCPERPFGPPPRPQQPQFRPPNDAPPRRMSSLITRLASIDEMEPLEEPLAAAARLTPDQVGVRSAGALGRGGAGARGGEC